MGRHYPQFRKPFRAGPLRYRRKRPARLPSQLLIGCAVVAAAAFSAPEIGAVLTSLNRTPAETVRREASAYYPNCSAARAAGAAPIYSGQPGYRSALDRDGDGIACEPYRGY